MLSSLISGSGAPELTSFFSFDYIVIFLPICLLIYVLTPQKARRYMLLALSFGFYWLVSGKLIIYLLLSIFSAHYFGLWLDRIISKRTEALKEAEKEQRKEIKKAYQRRSRGVLALAAVCYTIQLYMDFSGAMDAVTGIAQILGVTMPENFRRPFFSKTISEFWKRWHIPLGEWLKDYLFYPVTMSKPMQHLTKAARKRLGNQYGPLLAGSVALLCVWLVNGLWHGAAWNYILFGLYHFVVIMVGRFFAPLIKRSNERLKISPDSAPYRIGQIIRSDILIVIGELIFRANGATAGFVMLKKVVTDFTFSAYGRELFTALGVDIGDFVAVGITVAVVFIISLLSEKGVDIRSALREKHPALHYAAILALIIYIVILGAYGPGYTPVDPIYADF